MQRLETGHRRRLSIPDDGGPARHESFCPRHARERPLDNSGSFLDCDHLVSFQVRELGYHSAGPGDFYRLDCGTLTESKMESGILGGLVAHAALSLIIEDQVAGRHLHPRADTVSI